MPFSVHHPLILSSVVKFSVHMSSRWDVDVVKIIHRFLRNFCCLHAFDFVLMCVFLMVWSWAFDPFRSQCLRFLIFVFPGSSSWILVWFRLWSFQLPLYFACSTVYIGTGFYWETFHVSFMFLQKVMAVTPHFCADHLYFVMNCIIFDV